MAGHFVLENMTQQEYVVALTMLGQQGLTALEHAPGAQQFGNPPFPGWTNATRTELSNALSGQGLTNGIRFLLPPHRYLTVPAVPLHNNDEQSVKIRRYLLACTWGERLVRPPMGLVNVHATTEASFTANRKNEALKNEATLHAVSIEIYRLASHELV
jgi:hypothetical protein